MNKPRLTIKRFGVLLAGASMGLNVNATELGEPDVQNAGAIEEVTVTARKRSQSIQDVSMSITALTEEQLKNYRVSEPEDISNFVPNLHYSAIRGAGTPVFSLRGVSSIDYSFNQNSPIAVYVDDTYKGNAALLGVSLFDLRRVEVLRGPQGSLYGKNTTGGAVKFITNQPSTDNESYITVGAGNYNRLETEAAFNVAISDRFVVRLAGTYAEADGWLDNVNPGVDDANSVDEYGVRLSALWTPTEDLEVKLAASKGKSNPVNFGYKFFDETTPTWFGTYGLYNAFGGTSLTDPSQAGLDFFETASEQDFRRLVESDAVMASINWTLSDAYVLTSVSSWDEGEVFNPDESDGTPNVVQQARYGVEVEQFTQELRIASDLDGPLNFVSGLYYAREELVSTNGYGFFFDVDMNLDGGLDADDCLDPVAVAYGLSPSPAGAATDALFNSLGFSLGDFATFGCFQSNSFDQQKTSYAAYLDGSYELTSALTLRLGARYTYDEAERSNFNAHLSRLDRVPLFGTINGGSSDPTATIPGQRFSDSVVTGKIGLDYTMADNTLIYGLISRGYRGGAFNAQAYADPREVNAVDPEFVTSFEVGFKTDLWDGRLQLNGSAFHYQYEDQHFINFDPVTFVQTLINIDESEITGLELEMAAMVTPAVLLRLGVGSMDAEIQRGILGGVDLSGGDLPGAPDLNATASVDWNLFTNERGVLTLHVNGSYQDDALYAIGTGTADGYALVNARLTFLVGDERWSASLWGKNLAEKEYETYHYASPAVGGTLAQIGPPRTFGVEFSYRF